MDTVNWALIAPVLIIQVILAIVALIDLVRIHATNGPKWVWGVVILVVSPFGPFIYFIFGRKTP